MSERATPIPTIVAAAAEFTEFTPRTPSTREARPEQRPLQLASVPAIAEALFLLTLIAGLAHVDERDTTLAWLPRTALALTLSRRMLWALRAYGQQYVAVWTESMWGVFVRAAPLLLLSVVVLSGAEFRYVANLAAVAMALGATAYWNPRVLLFDPRNRKLRRSSFFGTERFALANARLGCRPSEAGWAIFLTWRHGIHDQRRLVLVETAYSSTLVASLNWLAASTKLPVLRDKWVERAERRLRADKRRPRPFVRTK